MRITPSDLTGVAPPRGSYVLNAGPEPMGGHPHFWQRAFSRRAVIQTAAGAAVLLGADIGLPAMAEAHSTVVAPKPIPETLLGNTPFHIQFPSSVEPSAITDFDGLLGATEIQGEVTGGQVFDADMRFMQGKYIGVDGKVHQHTFGFI